MTTGLRKGALGGIAGAALVLGALLLALAQRDRVLAANVTIGDNFFSPAAVSVPVGEAINWTNTGSLPHTATATSGASFDSGILGNGGTFSFTPTVAGTISYQCTIHPEMVGTITVTAGGGGGGGGDGSGGGGAGTPTAPSTGVGGTLADRSDSWPMVLAGVALVLFSGLAAVYLGRPRNQ